MSAPRPYVTDPFHPLGSLITIEQFLYICHSVPFIFCHVVRQYNIIISWYGMYLTIAHVPLQIHKKLNFRAFLKVILFFLRYILLRIDTKVMKLTFEISP